MKHRDLQPCAECGQGVMHTGLPLFWRVRIERYGVDINAVRRAHGLGMLIGNAAIANAMGTDEDIATPIVAATDLLLCETCAMQPLRIAALAETGDQG